MKIRSKKHLKFVASQPCLICGGEAQAHHLLRVGGKGMGTKEGDNWTVPLCFPHHSELHRKGNEVRFFAENGFSYEEIKEIAKELYESNL